MARAGRKRKLKPRYPSGEIRKELQTPRYEYTLAPVEQLSKREAILGSRTARGEIAEPFVHLRPLLSDLQVDVAQELQRLARKAKLRTEAPKEPGSVLGDLQPRGAISGGFDGEEGDEQRYYVRFHDAMGSMTAKNRKAVEYLTCDRRPMFSGGDPIEYFRQRLTRHLGGYRDGLDEVAHAWGWDKARKTGVWFSEGA